MTPLIPRAAHDGSAPLRHGGLRRRRQVHPDRPAAARLEVDLRGPARGRRAHVSRARLRLHRPRACSPTACAPSASRASRSTSRTATSRPRTASSSSPTRPGHVQYTRNMVTGASTADLGLVLVDARQGLTEQSRRHAVILSPAPGAPPRAVHQQDGPGRLLRGALRRDPRGVHVVRDQARHPGPDHHPDLGPAGRQRRHPVGEHGLVRRPVAAPPPGERARGLRPRPGRHPLPGAVRHPAEVRRLPRLPRLRGPGVGRHPQARRRGARAALGLHLEDRRHRPVRRPSSTRPTRRCR